MSKRTWLLIFCAFCGPVWAQNPVTIHVVDGNRAPIAGALIEVLVTSGEKFVVTTAFTDPQGTATFSVPQKPQEKVVVGRFTLHARGFAPVGARLNRDHFEFQLQKGATWRGKIVDEAGKPIEGAQVGATLAWAKDAPAAYIALGGEKMSSQFRATTQADGTFAIDDLPAGGKLSFGVYHPRFVAGGSNAVLVADEKTVMLLPGASLRGRVLDDKGAPILNTHLTVQSVDLNGGAGEGQTDAAGNFEIDGLRAGIYSILVDLPESAAFVVPAATGVVAEAGKTLDIAPLRGIAGVVVRGVVRDESTKKPLAGAAVSVYGPHRPPNVAAVPPGALTQADGRFEVRVAPGHNKFFISQQPANYFRSNDQYEKQLEIGADAPADLVFDLKPKTIISGVTVDENNRPIPAQLKTWGSDTIQSDANGHWQWSPDTPGPFFVSGGDDETGYFELNSFLKIEFPPIGVPAAPPLVVKLRKLPWRTLSGRVTTNDGKPLEGVTIKGLFFVTVDDQGALSDSNREAISDAQGRFTLPQIRVLNEARELQISAAKAGYAFQKGGEVSKVGGKFSVSDFVFVPLSGAIEGITAPGASVVAAGRETLADAKGKFRFESLPAGETVVFAAKNGRFGQAVALPNVPLQIELKAQELQGVDVAKGRQIWLDVVGDAAAKDLYALRWLQAKLSAPPGDDVASLKRAALEPPTPDHDWQLLILIQKLAPRLLKDGQLPVIDAALRAIATPEIRLSALLEAAIVTKDKTLGRRALDEAAIVMARRAPDLGWRENNLYAVAVVTEQMNGEKAGFDALDAAMSSTLANRPAKPFYDKGTMAEPGRDQWLQGEAKTVAQGSVALLKRLIAAIDPAGGYGVRALADAIPVVAQTHGIEAALPLLDELRELPKPIDKEHPLNNEPEWAFGQTARRLIPLLGEKSPRRALELARRVTTKDHQVRALAGAAKFQSGAVAAALWREVVQQANANDASRFAASAWQLDPKLGAGLFEIARQKAEQSGGPWVRGNKAVTFAFYFSRVDAAASRLILEREWASSQQNQGEGAEAIARAMSAIDANRADEMAHQIADKGLESPETRRKIGQYLQTSEALRRDFPFDRWGAGDTWEAGDEEW